MAEAVARDGESGRAGPRKRERVALLRDKLSQATSALVTDYRGLTVKQLDELRAQLRAVGVEYLIVKNTLARRAADEAGVGVLNAALTGPVGLALGYGDLATPAKLLSDYYRTNRRLPLRGGIAERRLLDAEGARALADLPPREVLLAQLAGTLQSPLTMLAGSLEAIMSTFASALDTYR
ncbi:MAG TPA: 50S ribosomal protein L10, partial [Candidatus Sulfotelmatobacter sp.]|nr:50S ribosomal protein L10 [Candidatus Sulfotelmatobacter sp.]